MKNTFNFIAMAVLGLSWVASTALAADAVQAVKTHNDFSFVINGHTNWGNEVYYSCSSIESYTENLLKNLGATNISVLCSGGIDYGIPSIMPSVSVTFDSIRLPGANVTGSQVTAAWTDVKLHDFDNCHLAGEILDGVKDHFDIRNLKSSDHCANPGDSYHYELSTLMAK